MTTILSYACCTTAITPGDPKETLCSFGDEGQGGWALVNLINFRPFTATQSSNQSAGPVSGTESDEDAFNMSDVSQSMAHIGGGLHTGAPSSLPPLSSIAERRSGSGEDSDDEDVIEGGWKTADIRTKPRNSVDESVIKSGYLWKKGERRKVRQGVRWPFFLTDLDFTVLRHGRNGGLFCDQHIWPIIKVQPSTNFFGCWSFLMCIRAPKST